MSLTRVEAPQRMASITGKPNPSYSDGYTIVWQDWYKSTMVS